MDDYISRTQAIDALRTMQTYKLFEGDDMLLIDQAEAQTELILLPSAEPVRHGRWTVTPIFIKCSECGESFMLIPQNYCPNCGARMDGDASAEHRN